MSWLMRSKLFVPASSPVLFEKALASAADVVCFDLEDGVLPARKEQARRNLCEFFSSGLQTKKIVMVRTNAVSSEEFAEDLRSIVAEPVAAVVIPKARDPKEIRNAAATLDKLEAERGLTQKTAILPTIESPSGLRLARAIAESDTRVIGLQLGLIDLFESLGVQPNHRGAAEQIRLRIRLAAAETSLPCFDSAFADFKSDEGFAREAADARKLGFEGKSCIHPSQIATANRVFSPSEEEIAEARRIVEGATATDVGVFALDGRMVDAPYVKRAQKTMELAERVRSAGMEKIVS